MRDESPLRSRSRVREPSRRWPIDSLSIVNSELDQRPPAAVQTERNERRIQDFARVLAKIAHRIDEREGAKRNGS